MADDTKTPVAEKSPEVIAGIEKRKRDLLPPLKPGECLNPEGKNGRLKNKVIVDFMDAADPKDKEARARIQILLESMYLRARMGHGLYGKFLGEQYAGKAKQQVELSGEVKTGHVLVIPMPGAGTDEDMERVAAEAQDKLKAEVAK